MTKPRSRRQRSALLSSASFRALCELQVEAIDELKDQIRNAKPTVEELHAIVTMTTSAITTHLATVIETDDGATEDADEDRGDTASA
jgi:hypothetical protein